MHSSKRGPRAQPSTQRFSGLGLFALALSGALSCAPAGAYELSSRAVLVREPDPARAGALGREGPFGVMRTVLYASTRGTDAVTVELTYPVDEYGAPSQRYGPLPFVVFVQGGLVPVARYRWLAEHFASRGYLVAAPSHTADLAFFESDNVDAAVRAVQAASRTRGSLLEGRVASTPPVIVGHSLGGVVATRAWIRGGYSALVLLASYPADGDPVDRRAGSMVLSLAGANDRKAPDGTYARNFAPFAPPRYFFTVEGMNHYDWCDGATAAELASDGPRAVDQAGVRATALTAIDLLLDGVLRGQFIALDTLARGALVGLRRGP